MGLIIDLRESIYWKADIIGMVRAATVSFHPIAMPAQNSGFVRLRK